MEKYMVETTIIQHVEAESKGKAEIKALKPIPISLLNRFHTHAEVSLEAIC